MKHEFVIIKENYEDHYAVTFYEESAHVIQYTETGTLGFFIHYIDFDKPREWWWYPQDAAAYVKKLYKNKAFL